MDYAVAGMITGGIVMVITIIAAAFTKETFAKDLNYIEEDIVPGP
jgi:MFS transporter, putative metabolite:H+ symporter